MDFLHTQKEIDIFTAQLMTNLVLIGMVFVIIWEMFYGRVYLNLLFLWLFEIWEWVQVGIDVYILYLAYQVKPNSTPWLSAAFAVALAHVKHFFRLYRQNINILNLKWGSSKVVIFAKGFLKLMNLLIIKQKSLSPPRNLALMTFGELLIVSLIKVNLLYILNLTVLRCYLLHLIKQNCFLKTFLRTLILTTQESTIIIIIIIIIIIVTFTLL